MLDLDKLNKISTPDTIWRKDATYRQENRDWLQKSAKIALIVLRALKDKSINQKDLALLMGVKPQQINKIVKGKENLTLETICKLENALNVKIAEINIPFISEFIVVSIPTKKQEFKHTSTCIPFKYPNCNFELKESVSNYRDVG